jgi:response regulator RpfG family c-di-GMP phosphodiesterase
LLHDVGKIRLPEDDGAISDKGEDFTERGARYVLGSSGPEIADAIRYQEERWDGTGPNGLPGEETPLEARIIALADAADTWLRPPNPADAVSPTELMERIEAESGTWFDPALVETALRLFGGM